MPELPEVETICRGIRPCITGQQVVQVVVRCATLRWPVPVTALQEELQGETIQRVDRRGKYLLLHAERGCLIVHLGMSGRLHWLPSPLEAGKHDHVDLRFADGGLLRFTDPRRFGSLSWNRGPPETHPLLAPLGPEPLSELFHAHYLWHKLQNRKVSIKNLLMDSHIVAGIGNIYAAEALFHAGLHPARPAGSLSRSQCHCLVQSIQEILKRAIAQGGTTVRDFRHADGSQGYFQQTLEVYGRQGEACRRCGATVIRLRLGGRASCCCPECQR
ncbi:MAG: bifunctional DNA-formamidopyrimidine glycosylase/DNA-(apurinic or apyrimidinic site) lyase [Magnetococcales bacterium]|nr:bifunctional DNA-formamidopyrimidine glycosylase/DNA-(apurinic or apyrimidinic site) lyase [Magnetococcales bacterium]